MNENTAALLQGILDECVALFEVLLQVGRRTVKLVNALVLVVFGVLRRQTCPNSQDVSDSIAGEDELALRCHVVAQE